MRGFLGPVVTVALVLVSGSAPAATRHNASDIILADQIDDELAHESDSDLVDEYILAYSVDFDWRIQERLKSGQITSDQARAMKQQFYAAGTGFSDQMKEIFDFNKISPLDERVRAFLRKSIRSLWDGKELTP